MTDDKIHMFSTKGKTALHEIYMMTCMIKLKMLFMIIDGVVPVAWYCRVGVLEMTP